MKTVELLWSKELQVMKFLFILTIFITISTNSQAMSGNPEVEPDPDCFSSDKIRVEIGGEQFAFPRKVISIIQGKDVIDSRANKDGGSSSGSKSCQKEDGGYWNIEYLSLNLTPKKCESSKECKIYKIDTYLKGYNSSEEFSSEGPFPNTPVELLNDCVPPKSPYSDFHKKYWSICNYSYSYNNLAIRIKFTGGGGIYPPENIENTKQLVLDEIYKHKIEKQAEKECSDTVRVKLGEDLFEISRKQIPNLYNGYGNVVKLPKCDNKNYPLEITNFTVQSMDKIIPSSKPYSTVRLGVSDVKKMQDLFKIEHIEKQLKEEGKLISSLSKSDEFYIFQKNSRNFIMISASKELTNQDGSPIILSCSKLNSSTLCNMGFTWNNLYIGVMQTSGNLPESKWKDIHKETLIYLKEIIYK